MRCSLFAFPDKNDLLRIRIIRLIPFGALLFWILSYSSLSFSVNEIKYNGKLALRKSGENKLAVLNAIQEENDCSNSEITGFSQQTVLPLQQQGIAVVAFSDQRFLFIHPDRARAIKVLRNTFIDHPSENVPRVLRENPDIRQSTIAEIAQTPMAETPAGYQVHIRREEQQNVEGGPDISDEQLSALALNPYLVQSIQGGYEMSGQQQQLFLRSTEVAGNYFLAEGDDRYYPVRIRQIWSSLRIDFGERVEAVETGSTVATFTINQVSDIDIVRAFQGEAVDSFSSLDLLSIVQRVEVPGIILLAYAPRCVSVPEISGFIFDLAFNYRWLPLQEGCMISAMSPVDWGRMQQRLNSDLTEFLGSIYQSVLREGNSNLHRNRISPQIQDLVLGLERDPLLGLSGISGITTGLHKDQQEPYIRLALSYLLGTASIPRTYQERFNGLEPLVREALSQVVTDQSWIIPDEQKDNLKRFYDSIPFEKIESEQPLALPMVLIRLADWMSNSYNRELFARVIQPIVAAGLYEPDPQGQVVAEAEGAQGPADDGGHQDGPWPSGSLHQCQVVADGNTTHHADERGDDDSEADDQLCVYPGLRHFEL